MPEEEVLEGTIQSVIHNSGSFYILAVWDSRGSSITAKGHVFGPVRLQKGVPLRLKGVWVRHSKYGRQLNIKTWDPWFSSSAAFQLFLTVCLKDCSYTTAQSICLHYGDKVLEALATPKVVLEEVKDDKNDLQAALASWERVLAMRALSDVLKTGGLTANDIEAAVYRFGSEAATLVRENPFRLMEIPGFDFKRVDALALTLGFPSESPLRLEGAVLWALNEAARNGHLFLGRGDIPSLALDVSCAAGRLPFDQDPGLRKTLQTLADRRSVIVEDGLGAYLPEYYAYERESARCLAELRASSNLTIELAPFLEAFQRSSQLDLSDQQKAAVQALIENKVLVLTGLPGTGKTTAVRALVRLFEVARMNFALMAPTGIASKRLGFVTGHPASTVHRALGFDGIEWQHGPHNKYVVDAVIVDEMSMVDQELLYRLLSALRKDTMIVFVGDEDQLPSVGPGNVLKEMVSCEQLSRVRLTQIFRQAAKGDIVLNSHKITHGEFPDLGAPNGESEFRFIELNSEKKIAELIVKMAQKLKARDANFQVLSPKYEGMVGVDALNRDLREVLNPPGPPEWKGKFQHFRVGDRIMVIKNNYPKGVYNGDVGKLLYVGNDRLVVRIYGIGNTDSEVVFTEPEADNTLRLAYAVTVHKSQGAEFDTVIMPVVESQGRMLQRNLLYTAVTRAKQRVWLLGQKTAIRRAIANNKVVQRNTILGKAISGVLKASHGESPSAGAAQERDSL